MSARVTIGGVDHLADLDNSSPIRITLLQNGRSRMKFRCLPGYTPARFSEVIAYAQDGVTPIYGGVMLQRSIEGLALGSVPSRRPAEIVGFEAYLDWCYVDLSYAAATTLQVALDDLVALLPAGYGITLDATDYSGIPLAAFSVATMRASDVLRQLCERTGRVYHVTPTLSGSPVSVEKVLSMPLPGGASAPVTITDADPHCREVTWRDAATPPVTTVKVLCGTGTAFVTQSWTASGAETSWVTDIPAAGPTRGYVTVDGIFKTLGLTGDEATAAYIWTAATHTLSLGTAGTPGAGTVIVLSYLAQYPFTVTATTGATPEIQSVMTRPDVFDFDQGQEIADGLLAASAGSPRELDIVSLEHGWAPGQGLIVDLAGRDVAPVGSPAAPNCAVTEVEIAWVTAGHWEYRIKATELSVFPGSYLDQWRALLAGSSSGSTGNAGSSTGATVVGGALPTYYLGGSRFHAVQVPAA